jgi:hypothetical protein
MTNKSYIIVNIIIPIFLAVVSVGSAVFLPYKIAGIITLSAFVVFMVLRFFTDTRTDFYKRYPSVYHPAYDDLPGNVYHSDND